uniref:Opsin 1 (cone pigments), short-wave-sensitive 2 n=1 Tax=Scophthalmus maximus TaxID=52904 RepID=A0A8D3DSF8_SCOMX
KGDEWCNGLDLQSYRARRGQIVVWSCHKTSGYPLIWTPTTSHCSALFLVPLDHLGGKGVFYAMAGFMLFVFVTGTAINGLTVALDHQMQEAPIEGFLVTLGGLWSLAMVGIERWLVNYKPLSNSVFKPDHALEVETYTRWPCDYLSRYIPEGLQCSCGPDWYTTNYTNNKYNSESYVMFLFCSCFAVPFATIIFCYAQFNSAIPQRAGKAQAESSSTQKAEREVSRMVVVVVMGFLVCWTPYASFALWVVNNRGQQT